jgi:hypothetical protein
MNTAPQISPELVDWARQAGYAFRPSGQLGAALFWTDPGGETRLFVRSSDGLVVLSSADRGEAEVFVLSSPRIEIVEDYLWDFFGSDVRSKRRLPWLEVPTTYAQLAEGFAIARGDDGFAYLTEGEGERLAQVRDGDVGMMDLVLLSHLAGHSVPDIKQSYESPDGRPIFSQHAST